MATRPESDYRPKLLDRLVSHVEGMDNLFDPVWVQGIIADTHEAVQKFRAARGLPEWDFSKTQDRTDTKRAQHHLVWELAHGARTRDPQEHRDIAMAWSVPIPADLPARVRRKRIHDSYSMYSTAARIGISTTSLVQIEKHTRTGARAETLEKIYAWLGETPPPELAERLKPKATSG